MADTSQQALSEPHTNGVMDGLTEEEKSKMRPADIDAVNPYAFNIFLQISGKSDEDWNSMTIYSEFGNFCGRY